MRAVHSDGGGGRNTRLEQEAGEKGSVIKSWTLPAGAGEPQRVCEQG